MTSLEVRLDVHLLFSQKPLTLYRLARTRYANLSGLGSAAAPGRWNVLGQEAIYTSLEQGTTLLERLVHTPKDTIPSNLSMMTLHVTGSWNHSVFLFQVAEHSVQCTALHDSHTGANLLVVPSLREAQFIWGNPSILPAKHSLPFAFALPSVVVPVWNVVFYPGAKGFWEHVTLSTVEPFIFDPRLFAEEAAVETFL